MLGTQFTFGIMAVGFLPVVLGLSFREAAVTLLIAILVGCAFFAPSTLLGPLSGTNGPVASGAFFGVKGRLIGSIIGVFVAIGGMAISVWVGGQILVATLERVFSFDGGDALLAVAYASLSLISIVVAVYGHALIVRLVWLISLPVGFLFLWGIVEFWGTAVEAPAPAEYAMGSREATMAFAAVLIVGLIVSYAIQVNDYTRRIPASKKVRSMVGASVGLGVGLVLSLIFGSLVAAAAVGGDPVSFLVYESSPSFLAALVLISFTGSIGQVVLALYSTGLDTSSIVPKLERIPATLIISGVSLVVVYMGSFVWDALSSIEAFIAILTTLAAPWLTISYVGSAMHGVKCVRLISRSSTRAQRAAFTGIGMVGARRRCSLGRPPSWSPCCFRTPRFSPAHLQT